MKIVLGRPPAHPPALVIRLALEAAPELMLDCLNESEERRLRDWLVAHPQSLKLIAAASDLQERESAA